MNVKQILLDPVYPLLKTYILEQTGLGYYSDKDEDFAARIGRRLAACHARNCAEYLELVRGGAHAKEETDNLVGELTIGETFFFRQKEHFDLIRTVVMPALLETNQSTRRLRFWSAGCATGAEAYSLSLLLRLEFADQLQGWDVSILGTDINVSFLAQARQGIYPEWALRETPEEIRQMCFTFENKRWTLKPMFVRGVEFRYHNLANDGIFPGEDHEPFDLVMCRNVMIYFSRQQIHSTLERIRRTMKPGGWLFVGHAEPNSETFQHFEVISRPDATAYRKRAEGLDGVTPHNGSSPAAFYWAPPALPAEPVHSAIQQFPVPQRLDGTEARPRPTPAADEWTTSLTVEDALMLADSGRREDGMDVCRKMIERNPLDAPAHYTLGLLLESSSVTEAEAEFRRAIYLDRRFAVAHYHLGTCLQRRGELAAALKSFRNVLQILEGQAPDQPLKIGEGITVSELADLAKMHIEGLES